MSELALFSAQTLRRPQVGDQLRLGGLHCRRRGPTNADDDKVLAKEPGAENGMVVATSSRRARTSTGAQMLAERRQIDVARTCAMLGHDMADMSCRSQIAPCRRGARRSSSNGTVLLGKGLQCPPGRRREVWTLPLKPQDRPSMERIKNGSAVGHRTNPLTRECAARETDRSVRRSLDPRADQSWRP